MDRRIVILGIFAAVAAGAGLAYIFISEDGGDYSKILVLRMHAGKDGISGQSAEIRYGHPPAIGLQGGPFRGGLYDAGGDPVREFGVWDPRVQFGDGIVEDGGLRGFATVSDEADILLIVPYTGEEERFVLSDAESGTVLADVDLQGAAANFSRVYPDDPSGPAVSRPEREIPLPVVIGGLVLVVLLTGILASMMKKR
jgi:hypothetical protein